MTPEHWEKIRQIFEDAVACPPDGRDAFLNSACSGDLALRREVEAMLGQDSSHDDLLDAAVWITSGQPVGSQAGPSPAVSVLFPKIGRYRILGVLGEGGMGTVYEAEQAQPFRVVALKVIRPGWSTPELLRRFEQESQALGRLQHPGIAQIYEAGTADAGFGPQPFFAMELIRGEALSEYARSRRLTTRQRLELMVQVCHAVDHAHQRRVIHRDLKPGNILVDQTGQAKILDFGVARVTDSETPATRNTDPGQLVGTVAYMSPEQVTDPHGIDARSDVYSMGVILYELLIGQHPYGLSRNLHEAVKTIQETEPAMLGSLSSTYKGDIETIVAKALAKERARRYDSAASLAADIVRYLKDEPIVARPASAGYLLKKFARRNRTLVMGVASIFAVLLAGVVASTWEAVRANRASREALMERDRATSERNRALAAEEQAVEARNKTAAEKQRADLESAIAIAVNDFLQNDLLAQASSRIQAGPRAKPDPDLKVRTVLDRTAARIEGKFATQPLVEASIRQTMAKTYEDMGIYAQAQQQAQRALELRRRELGDEHPDTLTTMASVANLYRSEGKFVQAEALALKVLALRRRTLGVDHPQTIASIGDLALAYEALGKFQPSEALFKTVLEAQRRRLGDNHADTLINLKNLADVLLDQGKYPEAEETFARLLQGDRRVYGEDHPETLSAMQGLGLTYSYDRKDEQAEPILAKAVEASRRVLGAEHPDTLLSMSTLAVVYGHRRSFGQAESLDSQILEVQRRTLGEEHPDTLSTMNNLAIAYLYEGKYPQAETVAARAAEIKRRVLGSEHPDTLSGMNLLAVVYRGEGKFAQAETLLSNVLEVRRRVLGAEHPFTLMSMHALAVVYRKQGKYSQADELLTQTQNLRRRVLGDNHPDTRTGLTLLGEIKLEEQKFADAELLLRQALDAYKQASVENWERYNSESLLGASLAAQGRYTEAEPLLVSGFQGMLLKESSIPGENRPAVGQAQERLVQFYETWNKPEQASLWREKLQPK